MKTVFLELQRKFQEEPYLAVSRRKALLKELQHVIQQHAERLAAAVNQDFTHRSQDETFFLEILPTITTIKFCLKNIHKWTKPRKKHMPWYFGLSKAFVFPQPLGVVGIIVPWNYPIFLSLLPAAFALAAGNRVMIKMSELSPYLGQALEELMQSSSLLRDHMVIINGEIETGKAFSLLPFGHLLFTGSPQVGRYIMEAASKNLTPVTLELGGKSPVLLSKTMNPKLFERIFMGKLFNAGQTCLAADYLLIPEAWEERIETQFRQFINARFPNLLENIAYTALISPQSRERIEALLADAKAKGGRIVSFGEIEGYSGNKMPISLIFNADLSMKVMQEEIFGPLLPVVTYSFFTEALQLINSMPKPLALYYFGEDEYEKKVLRNEMLSGALTINDTMMHAAVHDLPFGGVETSGMGQYHGQEGFDTFSKLKPVLEQSPHSLVSLLYPPYRPWVRKFLYRLAGIKPNKGD